jgi:hypothetical protein
LHQESRTTGSFASYEEEVRLGTSVCKLQTFEEWARKSREDKAEAASSSGWNKVSVIKLLTGRS